MNDKLHPVIGIDLGTTYSAVAVYNTYDEAAQLLADKQGVAEFKTTPSVIGVDPATLRVIVGRVAQRNLAQRDIRYPSVIEVKREMGEVYKKLDDMRKWGEPGDFDEHKKKPVRIPFLEDRYLPQELSAFTLMHMKRVAESALGHPVRDAVITVPAYFKEPQRKATEEAALLAGLYPRKLIPEPTAAAICYKVDKGQDERKLYLVYDLGGGTFDVSIIESIGGKVDPIAVSGDPRLGGGDFDDKIVEWAIGQLRQHPEFQKDPGSLQLLNDPRMVAAIKYHAEGVKIQLSDYQTADLNLVEVFKKPVPVLRLTRDEFNQLIRPLLMKSISYVTMALDAAKERGVTADQLSNVLLVGGSSKIRLVRELLLEHFQKDDDFVRADLDPDAVVARGAAIEGFKFAPLPGEFSISTFRAGAKSMNEDAEGATDVVYRTEHSLGIRVEKDDFDALIPRGTATPFTYSKAYVNGGPTTEIPLQVFQGEGKYVHENAHIGTIMIDGLEPLPAGQHKFDVRFSIDDNGLLSVLVKHLNKGKDYPGTFQQATTVGSEQALFSQHVKLAQMFQYGDTHQGSPQAEPQRVVPPAPAAGGQLPPPPPDELVAPAPITVELPKATAPTLPSVDTPAAAPAAATTPTGTQVMPQAGAAQLEELQDRGKVPADLRKVVRDAKRHLLAAPSSTGQLLTAYNAFIRAVNTGAGDVDELGDELCDAYQSVST